MSEKMKVTDIRVGDTRIAVNSQIKVISVCHGKDRVFIEFDNGGLDVFFKDEEVDRYTKGLGRQPMRGDIVMVRDEDCEWENEPRIFLENIKDGVLCVCSCDEEEFRKGRSYDVLMWEEWKWPEEESKEMTIAEIEEKLGHKVKVVK